MTTDPIMAVLDKLPVTNPSPAQEAEPSAEGPRPFGTRFAVAPVRAGKHEKTYYTVHYTEATVINDDGKQTTVQDDKEREEED